VIEPRKELNNHIALGVSVSWLEKISRDEINKCFEELTNISPFEKIANVTIIKKNLVILVSNKKLCTF
tara:strand:- start:689 stop:892 length:204 start_codon:yes stop_codon:yes gene_type:complete